MLRFLLGLMLVATPVMSADAQACRTDDLTARYLVADLKRLVTTTEQRVQAARDSFYHVPAVPVTTISLASADSVCAAAVQALNALYGENKARRVYVAAIGSGWAVIDLEDDPTSRFIPLYCSTICGDRSAATADRWEPGRSPSRCGHRRGQARAGC